MRAALARGVPVVGDIELFAQVRSAASRLIAITGSNGKSTVTTMVGGYAVRRVRASSSRGHRLAGARCACERRRAAHLRA